MISRRTLPTSTILRFLWNSFYSPNWLSPSHHFILLFLGGVAYSLSLLKFVGLESLIAVISQTESKKSTNSSTIQAILGELFPRNGVENIGPFNIPHTATAMTLLNWAAGKYPRSTADVSVPSPKRLTAGAAPWHLTRVGQSKVERSKHQDWVSK